MDTQISTLHLEFCKELFDAFQNADNNVMDGQAITELIQENDADLSFSLEYISPVNGLGYINAFIYLPLKINDKIINGNYTFCYDVLEPAHRYNLEEATKILLELEQTAANIVAHATLKQL